MNLLHHIRKCPFLLQYSLSLQLPSLSQFRKPPHINFRFTIEEFYLRNNLIHILLQVLVQLTQLVYLLLRFLNMSCLSIDNPVFFCKVPFLVIDLLRELLHRLLIFLLYLFQDLLSDHHIPCPFLFQKCSLAIIYLRNEFRHIHIIFQRYEKLLGIKILFLRLLLNNSFGLKYLSMLYKIGLIASKDHRETDTYFSLKFLVQVYHVGQRVQSGKIVEKDQDVKDGFVCVVSRGYRGVGGKDLVCPLAVPKRQRGPKGQSLQKTLLAHLGVPQNGYLVASQQGIGCGSRSAHFLQSE